MRFREALVVAVAAALMTVGIADAETAPDVAGSLAAAMGQERAAMGALGPRHVERILTEPDEGAATPVSYSRDWLMSLPAPEGGAQFDCLATALYFEARGETVEGQFAVAEVILNRVDAPEFPGDVCAVVNQGGGGGCQFSFACDGRPETIREAGAFDTVARVARVMLDGAPRDLTEGATYFHTRGARPRWSRVFERTAAIGAHLFYRAPDRLAQN
ncbi:MAG: cell wall hydrolase [Rhodobacteraceae bacterium]|nr:cell wall hydrolase [Paracoccaceae bacterium]